MEYFLNALLEFSIYRSMISKSQIEFACMSNITKLTLNISKLENLIKMSQLEVNKACVQYEGLIGLLKSKKMEKSNFEEKISSSGSDKLILTTEDTSKNILTRQNSTFGKKIDLILVTHEFNEFPRNKVGKYSSSTRLQKILTYKLKKLLKRNAKPLSRKFTGRSSVAKKKLRFRGRFVKKDSIIKKSLFKVIHYKNKKMIQ